MLILEFIQTTSQNRGIFLPPTRNNIYKEIKIYIITLMPRSHNLVLRRVANSVPLELWVQIPPTAFFFVRILIQHHPLQRAHSSFMLDFSEGITNVNVEPSSTFEST